VRRNGLTCPATAKTATPSSFSPELPAQDWDRHNSWYDAGQWLGGNANPGDTIEVLDPGTGGSLYGTTGPYG
jgi:hypothetical protein